MMGSEHETAGQDPRRLVAVVPHTHWDREWYLPFQSFRLKLVDLLDGLLAHLDADPGYRHFLLDGQLAVVDDYAAVRPGARDTIRRLVTAGRLSVGPWYTLPDEFLVSGETLVRDLQLGIAKGDEVGGAMRIGYLPDMFGHVAQMPQLLRLFGMEHAVVWRGVPSQVDRTAFRWVAPDGSEVRAEYLPTGYGNGARMPKDAGAVVDQVHEFADRFESMLDGGPVLWMNGTDHLLPQPWLSSVVAEADEKSDSFTFLIMSLAHYLENAAPPLTDASPTWPGELRSGARANLLMGVASNRTDVRVAAARAERALESRAEPASALFLDAARWPGALLDVAWLEVVRNAAHDSVCACSHDDVVDAVLHRYAEARHVGEGLAERAVAMAATAVDADGPVVVNLAPRARSGLVEVVLDGDGDAPAGTQLLRRRPAEDVLSTYPSVAMAAGIVAELEYVNRYHSARIVDADGTERFATARDDGGKLVTPAGRTELEAMMADPSLSPCTVVVTQRPGCKVLARAAAVPGYGWSAWSPAALDVDPVAVNDAGTLGNGLVRVTVDAATAAWTMDGLGGPVRLVDGGDVGDTYNWCPPDDDVEVAAPDGPATVTVLERGPLRGRVALAATWRGGAIAAETTLEVRAGEAFVRVTTRVDNRARDHRLRVHVPLPRRAGWSEAECAFTVVRRGLVAEGGPGEQALATYPSRRFVRAGGVTFAHEGLLEYELVDLDGDGDALTASALAVTLLRCTGMLSQVPMTSRPLPAGPFLPLEGSQLQKVVTARYAISTAGVDPYALVDDAFLDLEVAPGGRSFGGPRPAVGSALDLDLGTAQVSALRRDDGGALELRLFNPTGEPTSVGLGGRAGWVVDLLGRPLRAVDGSVDLGAQAVVTVRLGEG